MIMDDTNRQRDYIGDHHDDSYRVDYDERYVDEGYGAGPTKQVGGHEASGTGQIFCRKCKKFVAAHNFRRHTEDVHSRQEAVACLHCNKVFKNKNSRQCHIRLFHASN